MTEKNMENKYIKIDIKWFEDANNPDNYIIALITDLGEPDLKDHIKDPDEIVIEDEEIKIEFSYPLKRGTIREYYSIGGFTRLFLAQCIFEGYYTIYEEEEAAVGNPGHYENLYNRRESDGPYGIWGHDMCDLTLDYIDYNPNKKLCLPDVHS